MREALSGLESHGACVNGRTINNLHFADDIGLLTQVLRHTQVLMDRLDKVQPIVGQTCWMECAIFQFSQCFEGLSRAKTSRKLTKKNGHRILLVIF